MNDMKTMCLRHLQFAWWSLLCFVILGMVLEALHAYKIDWYLSASTGTRRFLWTLAHAHGALMALVHVAFAATYGLAPRRLARRHRWASALLMTASILLPGGFYLGGIFIFESDPGLGVWLVPVGGAMLLGGVFVTSIDLLCRPIQPRQEATDDPTAPG